MTDRDRAAIRAAYLDGDTVEQMASAVGVDPADVEAYLSWWCDRGCPGAVTRD